MKLCEGALKACCGEKARLDEVSECRKLTVYAPAKKRVRRGKSAGKKKKVVGMGIKAPRSIIGKR